MELKSTQPAKGLADFVESFWMIRNDATGEKEIIVLPDGRFDIIFSADINGSFRATLRGLDTHPEQTSIPGHRVMFAVSFKLLAVEYLLDIKMAAALNQGQLLPDGFWNIGPADLEDFDAFCAKISGTMTSLIKPGIDNRKQELFALIYASNGTMTVEELSDRVAWSRRQINRYFNEQFGISLKAYCNIFRFKASLQQIKEGRLFPELNFADQTHFIKEIKRFSGVVPKELAKNQNGRFILLSDLSQQ
ncbi:helix-turn-helix domain-containing protein [Chitinophaga arvensicola]|uniref:Helix-turn-helix domain-containing protein n=1 Tax=Chitinophaga arvensicola TaxID=29529 RepID=A0A1I0R8A2_9BACT|nr:AraC family transcriptional regulator [Chitinophaga arvensicola]SEW36954.1 Helix-turn-helix domain-containing protein [Chitinophaga arvensicola]